MAGAQIRRFLILPKELDADDGELTRTQKVRRGFIAERYAPLVEGLYDGAAEAAISAEITYEDGRKGRLVGSRRIVDMPTHPPAERSARRMNERTRSRPASSCYRSRTSRCRSAACARSPTCRSTSDKGEIRAIIGPNGAGKTSMLNVINGFYQPQIGRILFRRPGALAHAPVRSGEPGHRAHLSERRPVQGHDDARQHHDRAQPAHEHAACSGRRCATARRSPRRSRTAEFCEEIIDFLEIEHIRKTPVGKLPYGLQKRVELGRALAMEPELLLLDEPMAGMNLEEKEDMSRFIVEANRHLGATIALIEHDIGVVMDLPTASSCSNTAARSPTTSPTSSRPTRR